MKQQTPQEAGKLAAEALANFVNSHGKTAFKAFAEQLCHHEHRTLQQSAFGVMTECIKLWAKDWETSAFDARNEATCKAARLIMRDHADDLFLPHI